MVLCTRSSRRLAVVLHGLFDINRVYRQSLLLLVLYYALEVGLLGFLDGWDRAVSLADVITSEHPGPIRAGQATERGCAKGNIKL